MGFQSMSHDEFQNMNNSKIDSQTDDNEQKQIYSETKSVQIEKEKPKRDWIDELTLRNLTKWFKHKPGTKIGANNYHFNNDSIDRRDAERTQIEEIANLS